MGMHKGTFDGIDMFMIDCDRPDCDAWFPDGEWREDENDLINDARLDAGWQILYADEHPGLEHDTYYCPRHHRPECVICTIIMLDPTGWENGQCPECRRLGTPRGDDECRLVADATGKPGRLRYTVDDPMGLGLKSTLMASAGRSGMSGHASGNRNAGYALGSAVRMRGRMRTG